jgi:hypothetical protein
MIINITDSPKKNKRLRITMDNGKHYDFGLDTGSTYIDHHDKVKRYNYWARHYGNQKEKALIDSLTPSNSLFSAYILWGPYTNIEDNIRYLNNLWKKKHTSIAYAR